MSSHHTRESGVTQSASSFEPLEARVMLSADPAVSVSADVGAQVALLLPAVQKVTDAATRTADIGQLVGVPQQAKSLLLPAVQKVQEAADRLGEDRDQTNPDNGDGLLLPAVQKVADAAARTQEVAELVGTPPQAMIGLLLPAVQKVRDAAGG